MTTAEKAAKADAALAQLHDELDIGTGNTNVQRKAIRDYLAAASDESKARLYDIVRAS